MPPKNNLLVLSALGDDRPGIVDRLTKVILDYDCNIIDSRMTVLGGEFAILMLVEGNWNTLAKLEKSLPELQVSLGLTIISRRTEERHTETPVMPYLVEVVALDHPGIVHSLASFFSQRNINIEDLMTSGYPAAHTGSQMFSVHMSIGVPGDIHIASLRDEFMDFCDSLNLDGVLEPIKR
ncbi:MAG: glycine cleavage system protein R [Gammaproteobacteria bacterium]|nr:glycine cleavage system protein R [Gammaproteobacteria bacterium]MBU1655599.1 glycine cleavage system protein R [Gammaproteobacteria bacterium]MBU1962271.1 glycine cleavage system protein R [Gammaproteobacteria bacterium]